MNRAGQGVLIMAGGTGGHIYPGLAVADSLRAKGITVRWLGARGAMETRKVPAAHIPLDVVDIGGLRGKGAAGWLLAPWKLLRAVYQAFRLLGRSRPSCAVSFGGYAAGPGGLAALISGVPLLVHEQNRIPGMTNRFLARFADHVLQAFPDTWDASRNPVTCGNPVRETIVALERPEQRMAGRTGPLRVLLTGGSQGALTLNRLLPAALKHLGPGKELRIRHQAGPRWVEETRAAYREAGVVAEVSDFIDDMAAAYAWADIVLCRAGALTISEIAAAGVASVLVPYPHAVDDHQTLNARFLVEQGAAVLLPEQEATPEKLALLLGELADDRSRLLDMASRARSLAVPDSAERVAGICMEYAA